jgi:hypothetical protein
MEQQENVHKSPRKIQSAACVKSWQQTSAAVNPASIFDANSNDCSTSCSSTTLKNRKLEVYRQEQPKKRWLREACQDQSLWGEKQELAQPLLWNEKDEADCSSVDSLSYPMIVSLDGANKNENMLRPTVLMLACKETSSGVSSDENGLSVKYVPCPASLGSNIPPEDNLKWMGAMALMELATTESDYSAENPGAPLNLSQPRYTEL